MIRRAGDGWFSALVVLAGLLLVGGTIALGISECKAQRRCQDLGGRVEEYDCFTSYTTTSCGSGCWTTVPITSCSWRCVGAPAEAPR